MHPSLSVSGSQPSDGAHFLHSQPVSHLSSSKVTRQQEVTFRQTTSHDTVWKCQFKDGARRFEMEGEPVPASAELLLTHSLTGQALATAKHNVYNDFGREFEVSSHTHNQINKKQGLHAELRGVTTADMPSRRERSPNFFAFLLASPETAAAAAAAAAAATSSSHAGGALQQPQTASNAEEVLNKVRNVMMATGGT
jgi:hypothetical protein